MIVNKLANTGVPTPVDSRWTNKIVIKIRQSTHFSEAIYKQKSRQTERLQNRISETIRLVLEQTVVINFTRLWYTLVPQADHGSRRPIVSYLDLQTLFAES